jgi:hypothetical protein
MSTTLIYETTKLYNFAGADWATGLLQDGTGALYYGGYSRSNADNISGINTQADLMRVNADGSTQWRRTITDGAHTNAFAFGIALAPENGIYIGDHTTGSLGQAKLGNWDNYIQRYDKSGQLLWTRLIGTDKIDQGFAGVASDPSGQVYLAGYTDGSLPGRSNQGGADLLLSSVNPNGSIAWTTQLGSSGSDIAMAISLANSGQIFVAGRTSGNLAGQTNAGKDDGFLACFDPTGALQWMRLIGGSGIDHAYGVYASTTGSIYVTGRYQRNLNTSNPDEGDAFLAKYDTQGNLEWIRYFGSNNYEYGRSFTETSNGLVLVTGRTNGSIEGLQHYGGFDPFVAIFDSSGNRIGLSQIGSPYDDAGNVVIAGQSGNIFLAGMAGGPLNGQMHSSPGTVTFRKRTSTPEHALASETPTAKSKGLCQTGHGDVRP